MVVQLAVSGPGATVKTIALFFAFLMVGVTSAEANVSCKLPLYIQAVDGAAHSTTDSTANLFLYGLKSAVTLHQGCIVDKMSDAHLGLFITTLEIAGGEGQSNSAVVAVALAVPLNGILVYMDHYVLVVRDSDSVDGPVNALLESIGETLDRDSPSGQ
jgi:hypothetical protein